MAQPSEPQPPEQGTAGGHWDTEPRACGERVVWRAETTAAGSCAGSAPSTWTGAQLGWDNAGRLLSWQHVPGASPSSPSSTDASASAYDGEGTRVWQQSVTPRGGGGGGTTT
ncbi:MAG: hypothetical protein ACHQ4H_07350, partial [Ktedonobacterales bacterium]